MAIYAGKEIIMENKKPSIEEIFKNGVTVDYELYKSDYVNIKEEDVYDKYKSMLNKIDEFIDINKDVSEEYLRIFLGNVANINMTYFNNKFANLSCIKRLLKAIICKRKKCY